MNPDPKQFLLKPSGDDLQGALDMFVLQTDVAGKSVAAETQHFGLNFTQKQFEEFSRSGIILQRTLPVLSSAETIRIVIRNAGTSALGSVTVPVHACFVSAVPAPLSATPLH